MMESAGFKRFQEASKVLDENDAEVGKGVFETGRGEGGEGGARSAEKKASVTRPTIETVGLGDDESQGQDIIEEKKAPPDIFAAIFADSDDEDEGDDDGEGEEKAEQTEDGAKDTKGRNNEIEQKKEEDELDKRSTAGDSKPPSMESPAEPLSLDSLTTYKPSFTSRSTAEPSTSSSKPAKKKKTKRKVALSFDLDDGETQETAEVGNVKKRSRTKDMEKSDRAKSKKLSRLEAKEPEEEWEEAVRVHPSIIALENTVASAPLESKVKKPRMQASDLY
jgi:G patch domain-containing protein 1